MISAAEALSISSSFALENSYHVKQAEKEIKSQASLGKRVAYLHRADLTNEQGYYLRSKGYSVLFEDRVIITW